jgi:hypothetical protein
VTAGKALEVLVFVKRLSSEFRDPYTLKTFNVSLVPSFMAAFFYLYTYKNTTETTL